MNSTISVLINSATIASLTNVAGDAGMIQFKAMHQLTRGEFKTTDGTAT